MESTLTELEMGAVLQLIQLSGGDFPAFWVNFPSEKEETAEEEKSAGESLSSTLIDSENTSPDDDVLPRRNTRFGSLVDIYRKTQPSIKNRAKKKRARF
ncbi:hypothetical protein CASFOL_018003 [Castilleja foliolosa]|uniref:Uncharacterized protein n=1 Tax=Castilleja foliolosa TaxID=1961234 RepID=A0ABD3D7Q5_9LAMI